MQPECTINTHSPPAHSKWKQWGHHRVSRLVPVTPLLNPNCTCGGEDLQAGAMLICTVTSAITHTAHKGVHKAIVTSPTGLWTSILKPPFWSSSLFLETRVTTMEWEGGAEENTARHHLLWRRAGQHGQYQTSQYCFFYITTIIWGLLSTVSQNITTVRFLINNHL